MTTIDCNRTTDNVIILQFINISQVEINLQKWLKILRE